MNRRKSIPRSELLLAWHTGKHSLESLAKKFQVSRGTIARRFQEYGIRIPTRAESQQARLRRLTQKERQQLTESARQARELSFSPAAQARKAATRARTRSSATQESLALAESLHQFSPIPEMAIGPFNVDIGIPGLKVAIELDGGDWHLTGRIRHRDAIKEVLLHTHGWIVLRFPRDYCLDHILSALQRIQPPPV